MAITTKTYYFCCGNCDEDFEVEGTLCQDEDNDWYEFNTQSGEPECPKCGEVDELQNSSSHASDARSERQQMGIC